MTTPATLAPCPCGSGEPEDHDPYSWLEPCAECEAPTHVDDGAPDRGSAYCHRPACREAQRQSHLARLAAAGGRSALAEATYRAECAHPIGCRHDS